MRLRRWCFSAVICAAFLSIVTFALVNSLIPSVIPSARAQNETQFFPLSEVRPGLRGVGRTIMEGDRVTDFQVEMLGILKNVLAPKHDAILARFSGGGLEKTGVVAGMSGSPVYVDGKLVGAVAISFPFEKEPYGVITPIKDMLAVVPGPDTASGQTGETTGAPAGSVHATPSPIVPFGPQWRLATVSGGSAAQTRLIPEDPEDAANPSAWAKLLVPSAGLDGSDATDLASSLRLPVRFSGFSADAINRYSSVLRALGFEPLASGAFTGASFTPNASMPGAEAGSEAGSDATTVKDLEPGSMVSLLFVRGDLNLNADCTVTYRQGSSLYACGHQIFLIGPTQIPFAPARVLATVPSLSASFKVDAPGEIAGSIHQDRFGAIYGVVGERPPSIPVHIRVNSTLNRTTDYNFQVAEVPLLSPLLVNLSLISTLTATERMAGPSTFSVKGAINLSGGGNVKIEDVIASEAGAAGGVGAAVATPLNYLLSSGFPGLRVEGINLTVSSLNEYRVATLEQVWSTKSEVQPGDHIEVTAVLRTPSGESLTEKIPVDIPTSAGYQNLTVIVGGGSTINALEGRFTPLTTPPRDLQQAVRALNKMRRDNRVYALLMAPESSFRLQGDEFPSPPPSLLQTFLSDPAAVSRVTFSGTSVVGDFETSPTPYTIQGQQMLSLKVIAGKD